MPAIRLATWNINSVRLRAPLVQKFLKKHAPDVLCLQETKVVNELFPREIFAKLGYAHHAIHGQKGYHGVAELAQIAALLAASDYDTRVVIDPSVVRGLEYYTGPVFEAELTFEVKDEDGRPVRFGSVGGGGRYDGLVARFRGEPVPATGFSIGVSRLFSALKAVKSPVVANADTRGPVVVLVMDKDRVADYHTMVAALRGQNIRAIHVLGS